MGLKGVWPDKIKNIYKKGPNTISFLWSMLAQKLYTLRTYPQRH